MRVKDAAANLLLIIPVLMVVVLAQCWFGIQWCYGRIRYRKM